MKIKDNIKNLFLPKNKYKVNSEAIIISCYFNPQCNPYRLKAFTKWYKTIRHLNHRVIECVIGDSEPQLGFLESKDIQTIKTKNLLWHKESLLNKIISELPEQYKYVFWVDADVIFTNRNWLVNGVKEMKKGANILQPFEYCVHLEKDETKPPFSMDIFRLSSRPNLINPKVWRSFSSNYSKSQLWKDENYNNHGHVGFAWGAKREVLDQVPLYDRALIGGADHIIAHAAAGQIHHKCITKSFTEDIEAVDKWSKDFFKVVQGKISYVEGNLYHIWHGDLKSREYLKRIVEFTPMSKNIKDKDEHGLHVADDDTYVKKYFSHREVKHENDSSNFLNSVILGYETNSTVAGTLLGGDPVGAFIGDALNTNDEVKFGDGDFSGGGAGGSWDNDSNTENFS